MPSSDVSDLRDVVDAINKLCDTMKTSYYECEDSFETGSFVSSSDGTVPCEDTDSVTSVPLFSRVDVDVTYESSQRDIASPLEQVESITVKSSDFVPHERLKLESAPFQDIACQESSVPCPDEATTYVVCQERTSETFVYAEVVSPESSFRTIEMTRGLNWSDSLVSLPVETFCEPASEMYYTASSEVSLISDTEVVLERAAVDDDSLDGKETQDDRKDCVIAGHVAAMRERFESMTRTNTPCPDLVRSTSPSLDLFRNVTPSPDRV